MIKQHESRPTGRLKIAPQSFTSLDLFSYALILGLSVVAKT